MSIKLKPEIVALIDNELNKNHERIAEIKKEQNALLDQHGVLDKEHIDLRNRNARLLYILNNPKDIYTNLTVSDPQVIHKFGPVFKVDKLQVPFQRSPLDMSMPAGLQLNIPTGESLTKFCRDIYQAVNDAVKEHKAKEVDSLNPMFDTIDSLIGQVDISKLKYYGLADKMRNMSFYKEQVDESIHVLDIDFRTTKDCNALIDYLIEHFRKDPSVQYFTPSENDVFTGYKAMQCKFWYGNPKLDVVIPGYLDQIYRAIANNEYSEEAIKVLFCPNCGVKSYLTPKNAEEVLWFIGICGYGDFHSGNALAESWIHILKTRDTKGSLILGYDPAASSPQHLLDFLESKMHLYPTDLPSHGTNASRTDLVYNIEALRKLTKNIAVSMDGVDIKHRHVVKELILSLTGVDPEIYTWAGDTVPPKGIIIVNVGNEILNSPFCDTLETLLAQATGERISVEALYA